MPSPGLRLMFSVQTRKSCFFVLSLRNTWKTRNTEMRRTWLKSWKVSKVSSCFLPECWEAREGGSRWTVTSRWFSIGLFVGRRRCTASVFCFFCGKDRLLQFQSGFQGRLRSGPGGMRRGTFLFVVSRTFRILGGNIHGMQGMNVSIFFFFFFWHNNMIFCKGVGCTSAYVNRSSVLLTVPAGWRKWNSSV